MGFFSKKDKEKVQVKRLLIIHILMDGKNGWNAMAVMLSSGTDGDC